jgi:two-component system, chemotaxis family, CheB/CheR fusion protein
MAKKKASRPERRGGAKRRRPATKAAARKEPRKQSPPAPPRPRTMADLRFPVVGVGASAGGLEAMEDLLRNIPPDSGMAFVIVTHLHPGHTSILPELLGKCAKIPVVTAADGLELRPDHIYVGPPGVLVGLQKGRLCVTETGTDPAARLPIDRFFRSLAQDQKERAVCIVLSGTGTDGSLGLRAIKGESGMAMVQDVQSAKYAGMPSSASATGLADYVLPPAKMPEQLVAYARSACMKWPVPEGRTDASIPIEPMQRIFLLLRSRTGHDFSSYKANTIRRRIERRMKVHEIDRPEEYVRFLQGNVHEIDILFQELLIGVTSFFRDPAAFEALAETLHGLIESRAEDDPVRVWIPACSTGEEAYSIAVLLRECMPAARKQLDAQIFATDLDTSAIERARAGVYPDGIAVDVSPERLERCFVRDDGSYRVRKEIREMVIFAPQNVVEDPPFTKLDLISCRNVLIYLTSELQKQLIPIFHYALRPGGILFLGPSETVGGFTDLFATVDGKWKIYQRRDDVPGAARAHPEFSAHWVRAEAGNLPAPALPASVSAAATSSPIEKFLLSRFAPPGVIVNDSGDVAHIHGRVGAYLEPSAGRPRLNVLEMAREGLRIELAGAMREAVSRGTEAVRDNVRIRTNGEFVLVNLTVEKLVEPEVLRGMLLISFRPTPEPAPEARGKRRKPESKARGARELERELRQTKESLRTTVEELETTNEELTSTNEELQSMNEELQSTNEEMETSKEELQSLNEELTTVNTELESKVEELSHANDDMQNLLDSTDIATIFLDRELRIKRFTERVRQIVNLIPTDVGRPVADLVSNLRDGELVDDATDVLRTLVRKEQEVQSRDGHFYLVRIVPYRTAEKVVDGVVITFINIDSMKRAELYPKNIVDTLHEPFLVLDAGLRVISVNRSFCRLFRTTVKQTTGELVYDLGNRQWDIPQLRVLLERIIPQNSFLENFRVEHTFPKIGRRAIKLNARRIAGGESNAPTILLAMKDVTKQKAAGP